MKRVLSALDRTCRFVIVNAPWLLLIFGMFWSTWAVRGGLLRLDDMWTALVTIIVAGVLIISSRLFDIKKTLDGMLTGNITATVSFPVPAKKKDVFTP